MQVSVRSTEWNMYPAGETAAGQPARANVQLFPPVWVFAGRPCTVDQFADMIWPEECAEKTHFRLKWSGREAVPDFTAYR
jgi:hypothetical protein